MVAINLSAYRLLLGEGESVTRHALLSVLKCWLSAALSRTHASQAGHTNDGFSEMESTECNVNTNLDSLRAGCQSYLASIIRSECVINRHQPC